MLRYAPIVTSLKGVAIRLSEQKDVRFWVGIGIRHEGVDSGRSAKCREDLMVVCSSPLPELYYISSDSLARETYNRHPSVQK